MGKNIKTKQRKPTLKFCWAHPKACSNFKPLSRTKNDSIHNVRRASRNISPLLIWRVQILNAIITWGYKCNADTDDSLLRPNVWVCGCKAHYFWLVCMHGGGVLMMMAILQWVSVLKRKNCNYNLPISLSFFPPFALAMLLRNKQGKNNLWLWG